MNILIKGMKMPEDGAYFCEIGVIDGVGTITFHTEERKVFRFVEVPAADVVERKKGKWIDKPVYMQTMDGKTWDGFTHCSECKEMHEYGYRSNFCPNCGADMRKEEMSE